MGIWFPLYRECKITTFRGLSTRILCLETRVLARKRRLCRLNPLLFLLALAISEAALRILMDFAVLSLCEL